jgi:2-C-methyl-D-erythritol 4-phosphate cytidylyltransferase / 2-C-methyl-D-erythritol 2,4-cyclodiphosphate synthase
MGVAKETLMLKIAALVVAAGRGSRFGGNGPKQYASLAGRPLLAWAIDGFLACDAVASVTCVIHEDDRPAYDAATAPVRSARLREAVTGGAIRQESVRHGLETLGAADQPDIVLIHDAARPLLQRDVVDRVLAALRTESGAIPALAISDTLKSAGKDGAIEATVPRDGLWRAQTPQGFRFDAILKAHRAAEHTGFTDDADLLQAAGERVVLVEGSEALFKVTTPEDLMILETRLMASMETRTGFGYDVHAFGPGEHVTLGGVLIRHEQGLAGHSDADVGLHALCDAIYGALADGDIGQHFPPSNAEWKGADSALFLRHAAERVALRGGSIIHLDLTLVCEQPKIGPHRDAMRARIAEIAGLPLQRVAVKATTSERLGFTGRGEGIAAHAVATLRLPAAP